jgi:myosin-7
MGLFSDSSDAAADAMANAQGAEGEDEEVEEYSLESFALEHFRSPPKKSLTRTLSRRSRKGGISMNPWSYSRDVLKQPLLKKVRSSLLVLLLSTAVVYHYPSCVVCIALFS